LTKDPFGVSTTIRMWSPSKGSSLLNFVIGQTWAVLASRGISSVFMQSSKQW
jgi:hypothetical protein